MASSELAQYCLILDRMLWVDSLVWKCSVLSWGGHFSEHATLAIAGRRMWYRCRHDEWVLTDASNKSLMDWWSLIGRMSGLIMKPSCVRLMADVIVMT